MLNRIGFSAFACLFVLTCLVMSQESDRMLSEKSLSAISGGTDYHCEWGAMGPECGNAAPVCWYNGVYYIRCDIDYLSGDDCADVAGDVCCSHTEQWSCGDRLIYANQFCPEPPNTDPGWPCGLVKHICYRVLCQ